MDAEMVSDVGEPLVPGALGTVPVGEAHRPGHLDRVVAVVDWVLPLVRGVGRAAGLLALASAAAVGVLVLALVAEQPGTGQPPVDVALLATLSLVLLVPAIGLLLARWVVNGLVELPERLRLEPGLRREQARRLAELARDNRSVPGGGQAGVVGQGVVRRGVVRRGWGAGRILAGARGDLLAYASAFRLLRVSYLLYALLAAALAILELLVLPFLAGIVVIF